MIRDLNIKKVMKNAFRITKTKYKTALRVRVPGGLIDPECLMLVSEISSKYGDGKIHITTRQGFEILGIDMEDMPMTLIHISAPTRRRGISYAVFSM